MGDQDNPQRHREGIRVDACTKIPYGEEERDDNAHGFLRIIGAVTETVCRCGKELEPLEMGFSRDCLFAFFVRLRTLP